ncbi:MAG: histidinol-phosphate transaminase [Sphaerochaetaceae bacterium]|nr:histidinol-phosphate transaminase [Sphaerochaetaceae bacterium]
MSRFFSSKYAALEPYTPGEQPMDMDRYVKLNTNESPFPPSQKALDYAANNTRTLNLYSDPNSYDLTCAIAKTYGVDKDMVLATNGSDEILNFAFMAFTDQKTPALFADITYGFYPVYAQLNNSAVEIVPLREDFSLNVDDYIGKKGTVFIANPNAPTGTAIPVSEIERLVASDPNRVVVVDEAYVDFGGESSVSLVKKYENVLVCQTFSKSRSFAGGRLGYGIGSKTLISDLNTVKYSTNPYNINSMTSAMGIGILSDPDYTKANCKTIMENRAFTVAGLKKMGFKVLPSSANFIFVSSDRIEGGAYYRSLKEKGVLVRHFDKARISNWCRVSIGTRESMQKYLDVTEQILKERT